MFAATLVVLIAAFLFGVKFAVDLLRTRRRKHRLYTWPERRYRVDMQSAAIANLTAVLKHLERQRANLTALLAQIEKARTALRVRGTRAKRNLSSAAHKRIAAAQKAGWTSWRKAQRKGQ
jgi:hypothetical protein